MNSAEYHYRVRTNAIRSLENIQSVTGPKFVILHLPVPHGPFVFNPDGTFAGNAVPEDPGLRKPAEIYQPENDFHLLEDHSRVGYSTCDHPGIGSWN